MRFFTFLAAAVMLCASLAARADSITYNFTYSGTGTFVSGTANGSGSFTVTFASGSTTGTLSAFSFTNVFTTTAGNSTFTYGLADVKHSTINLTGGSSPTIATASLVTFNRIGSNAAFGADQFILQDSGGTIFDSSSGDMLQGNTTGGGTVTRGALAPTPEPSSILLLGTGVLGVAGAAFAHRRFARGGAPSGALVLPAAL